MRGRVRKLAVGVGAGALVALELPANLELEPPGVLDRRQAAHHGHGMTDGRGHSEVTSATEIARIKKMITEDDVTEINFQNSPSNILALME